jgi:hypothetical protein
MPNLRGALEVLLANRCLERAGKAELAQLLFGDRASMACTAAVGRAGNRNSPCVVPDWADVFFGSGFLGCGDRQPPTVADCVPELSFSNSGMRGRAADAADTSRCQFRGWLRRTGAQIRREVNA